MTVPLILLGGLAHDIEADGHHLPAFDVAELLVELRAAHHVGEQDRNLDILTHGFLLECARGEPRRLYAAHAAAARIIGTWLCDLRPASHGAEREVVAAALLFGDEIRDPCEVGLARGVLLELAVPAAFAVISFPVDADFREARLDQELAQLGQRPDAASRK